MLTCPRSPVSHTVKEQLLLTMGGSQATLSTRKPYTSLRLEWKMATAPLLRHKSLKSIWGMDSDNKLSKELFSFSNFIFQQQFSTIGYILLRLSMHNMVLICKCGKTGLKGVRGECTESWPHVQASCNHFQEGCQLLSYSVEQLQNISFGGRGCGVVEETQSSKHQLRLVQQQLQQLASRSCKCVESILPMRADSFTAPQESCLALLHCIEEALYLHA